MNEETNERATRRRILAGGVAILAAGTMARTAMAQTKLAQSAVQYQDHPKGNQKCSGCVNFVAPNTCKIVEGNISPDGYCIAYAPKA